MTKSFAFDVEILTDGDAELAEFVAGIETLGSNGEFVFAPLTPNASAPQFDSEPVNVVVIVIVPLLDHIAYHASKSLPSNVVVAFLSVQVKEGLEVTVDTVEPCGITER